MNTSGLLHIHTVLHKVFNREKAKEVVGQFNSQLIEAILKLHLEKLFQASFRDLRSFFLISSVFKGSAVSFTETRKHNPRIRTN